MSIVEVVEAIMFYIIVKILHDKKLTGVKYNWKKWALIFLVRRPKMAEVSDQNDWNLSSKLAEKILIKISGIAVAVLLTGNTGAVYFIKMGI